MQERFERKEEGEREREKRMAKERGRKRWEGMMKSSFMLYILCMKISDPREGIAVIASGRKILGSWLVCELTFFMDTDSTGTPETAVCGLHRVKLARWGQGKDLRLREAEGNVSHAPEYAKCKCEEKKRTNPGYRRRCMSRRRLLLATLGVLYDLRTNPNTLEVLSNRMQGPLSSGRKMGLDYPKNNVNWRDKSYVSLKIREIYRKPFCGV